MPRHVEQRDRGCGEGRGLATGTRQHSGGSSSGGRQRRGDASAIHAVRGLVSAAADATDSRGPWTPQSGLQWNSLGFRV